MKLGSSRGMDTRRPPGSERSKPCHELRLTRRSQPPYPWPPEQAQPGVSKPCRTTHRFLESLSSDKPKTLSGIVEGDETFILESFKGKRSDLPRKARKRGGKAAKR